MFSVPKPLLSPAVLFKHFEGPRFRLKAGHPFECPNANRSTSDRVKVLYPVDI